MIRLVQSLHLMCKDGEPNNGDTMHLDHLKRQAAARALDLVQPGMKLGLGSGSTAKMFVELLAEKVKAGLIVTAVPTSEVTLAQAIALGIPVATLDQEPYLDLTIDGADELDDELRLIKGGGGALLREKIVATASARLVIIADQSKRVTTLGRFPLPVEVVPFGLTATRNMIQTLASDVGCQGTMTVRLTATGETFLTDGGHYILDCAFGSIPDPDALAEALQIVPGVVEHGLFIGLADAAYVATEDGIEVIEFDYVDEG
jgi:ribose 5-phosphate isomerase A